MAIGFSRRPNPAPLPEHLLWTLRKVGHTLEARTRIVLLRPELRHYRDGALLWSQMFRGGLGAGLSLLADEEHAGFRPKCFVGTAGIRRT